MLILYQERSKKAHIASFQTLMKKILLFYLTKVILEGILSPEKDRIVKIIEKINRCFNKLILALGLENYLKAKIYIVKFSKNALFIFD